MIQSKPEQRWESVFRAFAMPPAMLAYFDWPSGLVRIDSDADTWMTLIHQIPQRPADSLSRRDHQLLGASTHECYHFMQFSTCGFLFKLARDFWVTLVNNVPEDCNSIEDMVSSMNESVKGLSLWLRHCPHLVTNGPFGARLQPATDEMLIAPEATA